MILRAEKVVYFRKRTYPQKLWCDSKVNFVFINIYWETTIQDVNKTYTKSFNSGNKAVISKCLRSFLYSTLELKKKENYKKY